MKKLTKLSTLALALLAASCNEKVSPELQQGNSTVSDDGTAIAQSSYTFGLENTSATILNYKLHKTGSGNGSTECQIRNTIGFSSDFYRSDLASNDITCFLEAEELSLYFAGFNLKVNASKNSCDYVAYMPYGYYDRIPGDSTATYHKVSCTTDETDQTHIDARSEFSGSLIKYDPTPTVAGGLVNIGCDQYVAAEANIGVNVRQPFTINEGDSESDLCAFNYQNGDNERCDIGVITVIDHAVTYIPPTDTSPATVAYKPVTRRVECGGAPANCVKGPTKSIRANSTRAIQYNQATTNVDFSTSYSYGSLIGKMANFEYANYRRNLANSNMDFINSDPDDPTTWAAYKSTWSNSTYNKTFEPRVADSFASNLMLDNNTPLVDTTMLSTEAIKDNTYVRRPLAGDPFLGIGGYKVNPFYTFYCLDTALDIKARIRLVVRDWDRIFPTTSSDLELLADIFRGASARQDIPFIDEVADENDPQIPFNDRQDWDDFIPMVRTAGVFDPFTTIWQPLPYSTGSAATSYDDGWFNPSYFPNSSLYEND